MTGLRSAWTALLLLAALLYPGELRAHVASIGVLEFREVRPGAFIGRWTIEPSIGAGRVDLRMPAHCFLRMPELNCGAKGLVGPITITNFGTNMSAVLIKIIPLEGDPRSYTITTANPVVSILGSGQPTLQTWIELAKTYVNYGIDHILLGADHLLFVLGLIWLVPAGWRLLETITAFTVGHSISLAAAAFGVVGIAERPLNTCIALSIVFVGVEMVRHLRGEVGLTARFPWAVASAFGLLHGVGFASALAGLGIEPRLLPASLLFFNVGVEIGQIAFVLVVLSLFWAHAKSRAILPRWGEALPAYAIGSVASFWFLLRI
jgi:HupE / UreJ protein